MITLILINLHFHVVLCNSPVPVDFFRNSKLTKLFTRRIYDVWGFPSVPVDLTLLSTFGDSKCCISITYFIDSNTVNIGHQILTRKPILAVFNHGFSDKDSVTGWIYENNIFHSGKHNSSWIMENSFSVNCHLNGWGAMFSLRKLVLGSKLWNFEPRVDLFPPYLIALKEESMLDSLFVRYENLVYAESRFRYPF